MLLLLMLLMLLLLLEILLIYTADVDAAGNAVVDAAVETTEC